MKRFLLFLGVVVGVLAILAFVDWTNREAVVTALPSVAAEAPAPAITSNAGQSARNDVEYQLAVIDEGGFVSESDPVIAQYDRALDQLQTKCGDARRFLADMAVRSVQLLADEGVTASTLEMLRAANQSIPAGTSFDSCAEIFASLVVLMTS